MRAALSVGSGPVAAFAAVDAVFGGLLGVFVALALTSWLTVARLVRGQVLSLKEREFVDAAPSTRTLSATNRRSPPLPSAFPPCPELPASVVTRPPGCRKRARKVVATAAVAGFPVPALGASLGYIESYTTARLPAYVIQAQRDAFGSHTYERTKKPGVFHHTEWLS